MSGGFISVDKDDLTWAAQQGMLTDKQVEALWPALVKRAQGRNTFDLAHLAFYFGALLIIGAMTWLLSQAWTNSPLALLILSSIYVVVFASSGYVLWSQGAKWSVPPVVGGLLMTVAVSITAVVAVSFQEYVNFHPYDRTPGLIIELTVIISGLLALRVVQFAFLTAPITFATWAMATIDLAGVLWSSPTAFQETLISVLFGTIMISISIILDRKQLQQDFAFWGYLFGGLAFSGGLTFYFFSCSNWESTCVLYGPWKIIYCIISVALMVLAVLLDRQVFVVYGGVGVAIYLFWIVDRLFSDSWAFPLVLTLVGLLIIYAGIKIQQWFHNSSVSEKEVKEKSQLQANVASPLPPAMQYVPFQMHPSPNHQHVVQVGMSPQPFGYYYTPVDAKKQQEDATSIAHL